MRRAARVEGAVVGAAVATSAARRPVVVAAPVPAVAVAPVVAPYPGQEVIVETYPPAVQPGYMAPPPAAYGVAPAVAYAPPPGRMMAPAAAVAVAAATPGIPPAAAVGAVGAVAVAERRHFYLINEATLTVLAVDRSLLQPGAHAVIERRRPDKAMHQIWYLDRENVIRSKLTDFALECRGRDERVMLHPYVGEARQQWILEGNRIVNRVVRTDCLGLRKMLRLKEDADVIMQVYERKPFQHWRMEPIIL